MKRLMPILILLGLISPRFIAAVTIVECEDDQGNRTFQANCPPGTTVVDEKRFATGIPTGTENAPKKVIGSTAVNVTLYSIPKCDPCDDIREFLQKRNISVTEKNVDNNVELQDELTKLTGTLKVPMTIVGEKKISGYNRTELKAALAAVGFKEEEEEEVKE